ncbi:putative GDP dissociation inhibitor, FAD/NAD(P)-binding domain-containing protein [Medicago truncatula]|uniref:Putative GDP dissociation inhibitor, FAD/NAD(P)-binding domain-containing protein n=1 Tax=Medicago truncatula TaxID=3880 RepID=A0A396HMF8_MEDTR|nr:putative GDP dissociation inhibitor, FAD/NAD(P)-binding domain-containing protein [Medicago truncatula]
MVDFDQENDEVWKDLLKTKEGIDRLAQCSSSVRSAPKTLLCPIYGEGKLRQAFCRRAAIKGCIYVLRMLVIYLLILNPFFTIPPSPTDAVFVS